MNAALAARLLASLALPGGSTPRLYLPAITALALDWSRVVVTLSDERWVPLNDPQSNERLVCDALQRGPAKQARVVGLKTLDADPEQALPAVETRLATVPWPLDLVVLGVGDDGHIASLFPGSPWSADTRSEKIVATTAPLPLHSRISLSMPALLEAHSILLVATGAAKIRLIERALSKTPGELPVEQLCAQAGTRLSAIVGN